MKVKSYLNKQTKILHTCLLGEFYHSSNSYPWKTRFTSDTFPMHGEHIKLCFKILSKSGIWTYCSHHMDFVLHFISIDCHSGIRMDSSHIEWQNCYRGC